MTRIVLNISSSNIHRFSGKCNYEGNEIFVLPSYHLHLVIALGNSINGILSQIGLASCMIAIGRVYYVNK
jgi:hypothetical protein